VHGGSVEAMKAAIELLTFDGFALTQPATMTGTYGIFLKYPERTRQDD
jgi:hypothetical protein